MGECCGKAASRRRMRPSVAEQEGAVVTSADLIRRLVTRRISLGDGGRGSSGFSARMEAGGNQVGLTSLSTMRLRPSGVLKPCLPMPMG